VIQIGSLEGANLICFFIKNKSNSLPLKKSENPCKERVFKYKMYILFSTDNKKYYRAMTEAKKNRLLKKIDQLKKILRREKATFGGYHDGSGYRYSESFKGWI